MSAKKSLLTNYRKSISVVDPAATAGAKWLGKKPKKPGKTAEQIANETRIRSQLDEEIREEEEREASIARGKLGRGSMLSGAPRTIAELAGRPNRGGGGGAGSLLSGVNRAATPKARPNQRRK